MSKESKITEEELKSIQDIQSIKNKIVQELGAIKARKHEYSHDLAAAPAKGGDIADELEKSYGKINLNIEDVTYEEVKEEENVEANQKNKYRV